MTPGSLKAFKKALQLLAGRGSRLVVVADTGLYEIWSPAEGKYLLILYVINPRYKQEKRPAKRWQLGIQGVLDFFRRRRVESVRLEMKGGSSLRIVDDWRRNDAVLNGLDTNSLIESLRRNKAAVNTVHSGHVSRQAVRHGGLFALNRQITGTTPAMRRVADSVSVARRRSSSISKK